MMILRKIKAKDWHPSKNKSLEFQMVWFTLNLARLPGLGLGVKLKSEITLLKRMNFRNKNREKSQR